MKRRKGKREQEPKPGLSEGWVRTFCILPVLLLLIGFNVFPLLASLVISFTEFDPIVDTEPVFIGLENYRVLLDDPRDEVWASFSRTAALVLVTVSLQTVIGYLIALQLRRRFFGQGVILSLLLIPMMLSPAIMATFWRYMLNEDFGLVNWLLGVQWNWNGTDIKSFWAVVLAEVWMWTPFMMLLSLAGLKSIPDPLYEAAEIDRASAWFRFRCITLPLSAPLVLLGVIFRVMDTFRLFDTAMVLNSDLEGQPTTFISVLLHSRGFGGSSSLGSPTALAYLLLIVAIALASLAVRYLDFIRSREA